MLDRKSFFADATQPLGSGVAQRVQFLMPMIQFWSLNAIDAIQRSVEKASIWMWGFRRRENVAVRTENG